MNRIYQGRVGKVFDDQNQELDLNVLWQHHELFQDAVNYYILALASLGRAENSPLTQLRERISAVWERIEKQGGRRDGIGIGLTKRFGLQPGSVTLQQIIEIAHDGGLPDVAAAEQVGEQILDRATGATGIRTAGRRFWPQLCDPYFTRRGNLAGGEGERLKEYGNFRLSTRLHQLQTPQQWQEFAGECQLGWVVLTDPSGATHTDSNVRLCESVNHFLKVFDESLRAKAAGKNSPRIVKWLKEHGSAEADLKALRAAVQSAQDLPPIPRNNRGDKDKTEALLVFKFQPGEFTAALLKQLFPHDPDAEAPAANADAEADNTGFFSRARGTRQYVLRAFTSFPFFGCNSAGDLEEHGWKEFDIAAFKEALTVVNQFNQNVGNREDKLNNFAARLLLMAGEQAIADYGSDNEFDLRLRARLETVWHESNGRPRITSASGDEESNEDRPPSFTGDPRIARLREIVTKDLADEYRLTEGRETPYGLRRRTMKGWADIKRAWQGIVKAGTSFSMEKQPSLQAAFDKLRTEKPEQIGSHRLFEALIVSGESWRIWREPIDVEAEEITRNGWARDPLDAFRVYCETRESLEALSRRELNFTPADARHSRRLFSFTDACPSFGKPKGEFKHDLKKLAVTVPIAAKNSEGLFQRTTVELNYSAPRLVRDRIRSTDGHYIQQWVQPMVAALCPKPEALATQKELEAAAVELMPDWDKDGQLRLLLNFSLDLSPVALWERIYELRGQKEQFGTRFSPRDKKNVKPLNGGLWEAAIRTFWEGDTPKRRDVILWPSDSIKKQDWHPRPWWEQLSSFRVLSADLGTRHAASTALVEAAAGELAQPTTARFIGEAGGKNWFARFRGGKILRLPGEDAETYRHQTRLDVERGEPALDRKQDRAFREELHGSRGRFADDNETCQFRDILTGLGYEELIPDEYRTEAAVPKLRRLFSFPEQNDKLLVALRWTQRHLADLISQHWRLLRPEKPEQTEAALKELREQKRYPEIATVAADLARRTELIEFLHHRVTELRRLVQEHLLNLTERIIPLRERRWEFVPHPQAEHFSGCHLLQFTEKGKGAKDKRLPGQRGLSTARIEQLSELRRRWQSLNQSLRRPIGEPPLTAAEMRANPIPDPCPDILRKLDDIREQRVNQTGHMILAEALGLQLREPQRNREERERADIHGEYKVVRPPVDFIVLENLDRYKANQGRAKSENSRLMQWCHRAVVDKIKELAEPFGIPVLETPAAYSSRFCSITGIAGFRAVEVSLHDRQDYRWRRLLREADEKLGDASGEAKRAKELFAMLEQVNVGRSGKELHTLLAPQPGGPIFVTAKLLPHPAPNPKRKNADRTIVPLQSDINAAANLALRAIAHPACADIHHRIRTAWDEDSGFYRTKEKRRFGDDQPVVHVRPGDSLPKERNPNLFYDPWQLAEFDRAKLKTDDSPEFMFSSGRGLWKKVNDSTFQWARCMEINAQRSRDWDHLPM